MTVNAFSFPPSDFARLEFQRQHPHANQIAAVDTLVALGNYRARAEQPRALGRPVARRSRAVLFTRNYDQRHAGLAIANRGVVDGHFLAAGDVQGPTAFGTWRELIAQPDIPKCSAHHHFVIAAPRAIRVELVRLDSIRDEVSTRRRIYRN